MAMQSMVRGHDRATQGMPVGCLQQEVICNSMPPRDGPSGTGEMPMSRPMPKSRPIMMAVLCGFTVLGKPALSQCMEAQEINLFKVLGLWRKPPF